MHNPCASRGPWAQLPGLSPGWVTSSRSAGPRLPPLASGNLEFQPHGSNGRAHGMGPSRYCQQGQGGSEFPELSVQSALLPSSSQA